MTTITTTKTNKKQSVTESENKSNDKAITRCYTDSLVKSLRCLERSICWLLSVPSLVLYFLVSACVCAVRFRSKEVKHEDDMESGTVNNVFSVGAVHPKEMERTGKIRYVSSHDGVPMRWGEVKQTLQPQDEHLLEWEAL